MTKDLYDYDVDGISVFVAETLRDDLLREARLLKAEGYDRAQMVDKLSDCFVNRLDDEIDRVTRNGKHSPIVYALAGFGEEFIANGGDSKKVALWILDLCDEAPQRLTNGRAYGRIPSRSKGARR